MALVQHEYNHRKMAYGTYAPCATPTEISGESPFESFWSRDYKDWVALLEGYLLTLTFEEEKSHWTAAVDNGIPKTK